MGLKTEKKRVGEVELTCTQFEIFRSLDLIPRLGKILGGAMAQLPDNFSMDDGVAIFAPALSELFSRLDEANVRQLVLDILASTRAEYAVDGTCIVTDLNSSAKITGVFGGDLGALLQAVQFALEVNYRDFLSGALATVSAKAVERAAAEQATRESKSTSGSISQEAGQSGDSG